MLSYLEPERRGGVTGERGEEEILENETVYAKVLSGKEFSGRNGRGQMWLEQQ